MKFLSYLFLGIFLLKFNHGKIFHGCRFARRFYQKHSKIFQLDQNQTSLTIQPLYALTNQSFSTLSIGIIYPLADTYLVPVPLLFQCSKNEKIFAPVDCKFTIVDTRVRSDRTSESTRTTTVPLDFREYSSLKSFPIRGAYFKQSTIALENCRLNIKENHFISDIFHLQIQFEQKIHSPCQDICIHPQLYQCSSISNTCQCRSPQNGIEISDHLCIDTELGSNCSLTPERCRRICRISDQINPDCQCPLGTQRMFSNNTYHCDLPILSECHNDQSSLSFILIGLLLSAFLIIIILIISLLKMRSIKSIKFIHPLVISLSSSSKSTKKIYEKYTKINLLK